MFKNCLLAIIVLALALAPGAMAQDENPTIAILRLGPLPNVDIT